MSGAGWFGYFSGKPKASNEIVKNSILRLRSQIDMLEKRRKMLEGRVDEEDALARKYVTTRRSEAKRALSRKKLIESQLEKTHGQIASLEIELFGLETANINKETFGAIQDASKALKNINGGLTIEKVDKTMDELREQHDIGDEIGQAISSGAHLNNPVDEDEIDAELEALAQASLDEKLLGTGSVPVNDKVSNKHAAIATPNAPSRLPSKQQLEEEEDEEAELEKLRLEMAS